MVKNKYKKLLKKYKNKFNNKKIKKIINKLYPIFKFKISKKTFLILLLMICYIFFNKFIFIARTSPEEYIFDKVLYATNNLKYIFKGGLISLNKTDISLSIVTFIILTMLYFSRTKRKFKTGVEYGSARWSA